jgi:phage portal protein BeeE
MYAGVMNGVGRYMVLSNNIDVQVVSQPIKDLTVPELANYARREVALALGVPQTMLEDTSNRASREQDTKTFWDTTVKMRVNSIASAVTRQFYKRRGLELYADWERMEIFQEDEVERTGRCCNW